MKKLLTALAITASLASPVEVEAKYLPFEETAKTEYTQNVYIEDAKAEENAFQYVEDNGSEWTDEDAEAFGVGMLILFFIVLGIYFIPFSIAMMRGSDLTAAVFVVNLFLGWSGIGWIAALVMAVLPKGQKQQTIIVHQSSDGTPNTTTTPGGVEKIQY